MQTRLICLALAALLFQSLMGCGESDHDPNDLKVGGKVTFNGAAVPNGSVSFLSKSASGPPISRSCEISSEGTYSVWVPPGEYQVGIVSQSSPAGMDPKGNAVPAKYLVPEKYGDPSNSGLTASISKDKTTADFAITE